MIGLSDGAIGKGDPDPIATIGRFDLAGEIDGGANRNIDGIGRSTRICVRIGDAFAAIAHHIIDIRVTRLARADRTTPNRTGPGTDATSSRILRTARGVGRRFVEHSVAIIIEAVADFRSGTLIAIAHEHPVRARRRPSLANALLTRIA